MKCELVVGMLESVVTMGIIPSSIFIKFLRCALLISITL